jgi:phage replication O-like protein O
MVGGPVSGITVIDTDTPEASGIFTSFGLEPHVSTPRGGAHFYFSDSLPTGIRTIDGIKFEVRGAGTYANFSGYTQYGQYQTHQIALEGPEALWHLSDVGKEVQRVLRGIKGAPKPTKMAAPPSGPVYEGQRHIYLVSAAGSIRHLVTQQEGRDILMALNNVRCKPPLDFEEVMQIADSAARYGYREEHVTVISDTFMEALSRVKVTPSAHCVLLALTHKTLGYGKTKDTISRTQLEEATGLLGPNVSRAVAELRDKGIIEVVTNGRGRYQSASTYGVLHPSQWAV